MATIHQHRRNPSPTSGGRSDLIVGGIILIIVGLGAITFFEDNGDPQPLPANNTIVFAKPISRFEPKAPFSVVADKDNPETNYYIKVSDWNTELPVASLFLRGGNVVKTELPLGTYKVTIAQGTTWYGPEHLFGFTTDVQEGVEPTKLYKSGPNQTIGTVITLRPRIAGNYPTRPAGRSAFGTAK